MVLEEMSVRQDLPTDAIRDLISDPPAGLARLAYEIETYWDLALAPYWPRMRSLCESDVLYRARLLAQGGVRLVFADLSPQISLNESSLRIDHLYTRGQIEVNGRGLLLVPSVFASNRVFSLVKPPWQVTVRYPPRGMGMLWRHTAPVSNGPLVKLLGATRVKLLVELDEPVTTRDIAMKLDITDGAVSQQLSILSDAKMVRRHRIGRKVLYARTDIADRLLAEFTDAAD